MMNDSNLNNLDVLYTMVKARQDEAVKAAQIERTARAARFTSGSPKALTERPAGLLETVLLVVGRWGRQAAEPMSR